MIKKYLVEMTEDEYLKHCKDKNKKEREAVFEDIQGRLLRSGRVFTLEKFLDLFSLQTLYLIRDQLEKSDKL